MSSLIPQIKWYQLNEFIYISFDVKEIIEKNIVIENDYLNFDVLTKTNNYKIEFELFSNI